MNSPDQQQNYEYEEGSPNEGVDANGDSISKKLVGSRVARKRAEEDVKLLANRIALLKMEEQKVRISFKGCMSFINVVFF